MHLASGSLPSVNASGASRTTGARHPTGNADTTTSSSCRLTQGKSPRSVAGGKDYYKEGRSIPSPLELVRFAGHGGREVTAPRPVTVGFSPGPRTNDRPEDHPTTTSLLGPL